MKHTDIADRYFLDLGSIHPLPDPNSLGNLQGSGLEGNKFVV